MAKMSLSMKQTQSLKITPQLQQAIKLLTLTHLEMTDLISQEMVENPMLEETGNEASTKEIESDNNEKKEISADDFSGPEIVEKDNFDWEKYVEGYNNNSSTPVTKENYSKDDLPNYENMVSKGQSLTDHLEWQLRMEDLTDDQWDLALNIIHNIDDDGYLSHPIEEILSQSKLDREDSLDLLKVIQYLDPVGCAASSLLECLLIQARSMHEYSPLVEILIKNHLKEIESKDYKKMAKEVGVSENAIRNAEMSILELNPKPGRLISNDETQYVVPDIFVKEVSGEFVIKLNNEGVPRLKISNLYRNLIKNKNKDDEASEYVQEKLRAAKWLIKSIEQRQKTIEKVANAIILYQPEFFKKGPAFLKPMILKDIAQEIGMHESTVSRVTTNKYMHTPIGTLELKYFFNAGIGSNNGGIDIASEGLKLKIKEIVENENPRKPFSDQKICDILGQGGIKVARRTIAKYREILNISSSSKRKLKS